VLKARASLAAKIVGRGDRRKEHLRRRQEHRGDLAPEFNRVAAMPRAGSDGKQAEGVPYLSHRTGQTCHQNNKTFRSRMKTYLGELKAYFATATDHTSSNIISRDY
jgi:hypothetical protein